MISKQINTNNINFSEGEVILFDKPSGISSFDVIRRIKRIVKIKKIGHAGTLDPMATGLLILCTGKFTKKINEYQAQEKIYSGEMTMGGSTPSFDSETEIDKTFDYSDITHEQIVDNVKWFLGEIEQVPPIYSALKVNGERLYKKAKRGETVEIKPRNVHIYEFEILTIDLPKIEFRVRCSKGTYIRSLIHDFGKSLNNGAYMTRLRRDQIGDFSVEDAVDLEGFQKFVENVNIESL